jgi:hypothetical protein
MTEYERFGLVFTKTRVYKFGHWCGCVNSDREPAQVLAYRTETTVTQYRKILLANYFYDVEVFGLCSMRYMYVIFDVTYLKNMRYQFFMHHLLYCNSKYSHDNDNFAEKIILVLKL